MAFGYNRIIQDTETATVYETAGSLMFVFKAPITEDIATQVTDNIRQHNATR